MGGSDWPGPNLARVIAMELWEKAIPSEHSRSKQQKDHQRWIGLHLDAWLENTFPDRFRVRTEAVGGGVKPVRVLGTSFWPDISIESTEGDPLVAAEVKCLRRTALPNQMAQALGQALMYKQVYAQGLVAFGSPVPNGNATSTFL
jgi:hypothetical protein